MKKIFISILFIGSLNYSFPQENIAISIGISGYYYNTSNDGSIVGLSGKVNYALDSSAYLSALVRSGRGFGLLGATEHRVEWDNNINSLLEVTFIYRYNLPDVLKGLSVGSGISYLTGKKENKIKYSYLCLPIVLNLEIEMTKDFSLNMGFNSNFTERIALWGLDIGFIINL